MRSAEDVLFYLMMWNEGDDYAIYSGNILLQQTTLRGSVLSHDQCLGKLVTWMPDALGLQFQLKS